MTGSPFAGFTLKEWRWGMRPSRPRLRTGKSGILFICNIFNRNTTVRANTLRTETGRRGFPAAKKGQMTNLVLDLDLCEIRNVLLATPAVLRQQTAALPDRITDWHSGPGCWCVKQIVGHLIEEDKRDFVERIRLIIEHDEPRLGINDQDEIARMRRDCIKSLNVLLEEFDA